MERLWFLLIAGILVVLSGLVVDGLVGTMIGMFSEAEGDSSVQARANRWPRVLEFVAERPLFGRGYGTYTNSADFLLDNQLQKTVIESGMIGLAALILFLGSVVAIAYRINHSRRFRLAGGAIAAAIAGLMLSLYTFDALFYRIFTCLLYVCIGLAGALWRIAKEEAPPPPPRATTVRSPKVASNTDRRRHPGLAMT
jgi:O-antigen ligase